MSLLSAWSISLDSTFKRCKKRIKLIFSKIFKRAEQKNRPPRDEYLCSQSSKEHYRIGAISVNETQFSNRYSTAIQYRIWGYDKKRQQYMGTIGSSGTLAATWSGRIFTYGRYLYRIQIVHTLQDRQKISLCKQSKTHKKPMYRVHSAQLLVYIILIIWSKKYLMGSLLCIIHLAVEISNKGNKINYFWYLLETKGLW
jgi:hypothetical protein